MTRLLLVDDEPGVLDALSDSLSEEGYEVDTAARGGEAIEKVKANPPDLILLDIRMPGMDGLETLRRVLEVEPGLGVIMVTAVHDEDVAKQAMARGAFDYVTKPIDLKYLKMSVLVKGLMGRTRNRPASRHDRSRNA